MANSAVTDRFERWLQAYGQAWEARDSAAAVRLFSKNAAYHWTPFDPPYVGRAEIAAALEATRWNVTEVSRLLGIPRTSLYRKLKQYGLKRER